MEVFSSFNMLTSAINFTVKKKMCILLLLKVIISEWAFSLFEYFAVKENATQTKRRSGSGSYGVSRDGQPAGARSRRHHEDLVCTQVQFRQPAAGKVHLRVLGIVGRPYGNGKNKAKVPIKYNEKSDAG